VSPNSDMVDRRNICIVGSTHSGRRGDFRSGLFAARRRFGSTEDGFSEITTVPLDGLTGALRLMGLAATSTGFAAVAGSSDAAFLTNFDHNFRQTEWHELPGGIDPHGLLIEEDRLWLVSSGSNEVILYRMTESGPGEPQVVYRHISCEPQHFNGLARHQGKLILSAFGVSANGARSVSSTGYLIDIETGQVVRSSLDQPHSPISQADELWFCESQSSTVWRGEGRFLRFQGYLRGLVVAPDRLIHVAVSASRPPRELLTDNRPPATLLTLAPDGSTIACNALTGVESEIYDLIAF
jgi:Domain of unknown function (DUF4915)